MFTKSLLAAVLVVAASSAAFAGQAYQGGPKSGLTTIAQRFEANKPYAQDVTVRSSAHIYSGGPKSTIPHGR